MGSASGFDQDGVFTRRKGCLLTASVVDDVFGRGDGGCFWEVEGW